MPTTVSVVGILTFNDRKKISCSTKLDSNRHFSARLQVLQFLPPTDQVSLVDMVYSAPFLGLGDEGGGGAGGDGKAHYDLKSQFIFILNAN